MNDDKLGFNLEAIALAEGRPFVDIANEIEMPDGRTAKEWVLERPALFDAYPHWAKLREQGGAR